jgi:molybdate transport system substrate-binding protein
VSLLRKEQARILCIRTILASRRILVSLWAGLLLLGMVCSPSSLHAQTTSLTVSAAVSLKDALDELGKQYQKSHSGTTIQFNYGGSGTLQHQIEQGAPADLFVSAAEKQMDTLSSEGLIDNATRRDVVANSLVLIVPSGSSSVQSFQDLTKTEIKVIALGEIATVPAGQYADQTLKKLGLDAVEKKAVYAKDVRQVLTYVETGNADAGMVYQTDAATSAKVRVVATAPANSHDPIVYPGAVLKGSKNEAASRGFLDFLSGSDARAVFEKLGFAPAEKNPEGH